MLTYLLNPTRRSVAQCAIPEAFTSDLEAEEEARIVHGVLVDLQGKTTPPPGRVATETSARVSLQARGWVVRVDVLHVPGGAA